MSITPFCTVDDVISIYSQAGVNNSVDDDRSGEISSQDLTWVANAIERATSKLRFYLSRWYDLTTLPGNTWIKWVCATITAVKLARRRGDSCPDGLIAEYEECSEQLGMIIENVAQIPADGANDAKLLIQNSGLQMSNLRIDQRFKVSKVRAVPRISTGPYGSKFPRFIDYVSTIFIE